MNHTNRMSARFLYAFCGAAIATSCAGAPNQGETAAHTKEDPVSSQMRCVQEWRQMLEEWEDHSKGSATSLGEVRAELSESSTLRIAQLAQNAWRLQKKDARPGGFERIGEWPVPEAVKRSVTATVKDAADGIVSRDCQDTATFVLPQLLGEEIASERPASPLRNVDVSQVDPTRAETSRMGQWLFFWLLTAR